MSDRIKLIAKYAREAMERMTREPKDPRIEQVKRILAMLQHATYPGLGMWRFRIASMMVDRGANAEAETGEHDIAGSVWFAAALNILMMNPKKGCYEWNCFTPKEMTEVAKDFLPAARSLIRWVNTLRKREAAEQNCGYTKIFFADNDPAGIIMEKLGGYRKGPSVPMIKALFFKEDFERDMMFDPTFFQQIEWRMATCGDDIEFEEATDEADQIECTTIAEALWEDRAEREGHPTETSPDLDGANVQSIIETLSTPDTKESQPEAIAIQDEEHNHKTGMSHAEVVRLNKILDKAEQTFPVEIPDEHKDTPLEIKQAASQNPTTIDPTDNIPFLNGKFINFLVIGIRLPQYKEAINDMMAYCDAQAQKAIAIKSAACDLWMGVRTALQNAIFHHPFVTEEDVGKQIQDIAMRAKAANEKLNEDAHVLTLSKEDVPKRIEKFLGSRSKQYRMTKGKLKPGRALSELQEKQIKSGAKFLKTHKGQFTKAAKAALTYEEALIENGDSSTNGYLGKSKGNKAKAVEALAKALGRLKKPRTK